jgi:hypothetical protein
MNSGVTEAKTETAYLHLSFFTCVFSNNLIFLSDSCFRYEIELLRTRISFR